MSAPRSIRIKSASTPRPGALAVASVAALALLLSGCVASRVSGPDVASSTPAPGPAPTHTALPPNYTVHFDPDLKTPSLIYNIDASGSVHPGEPAPFSNDVAIKLVRDFVLRWHDVFLFRPGTDDLAVIHAEGGNGENVVRLRQTYLDVPVDGMEYASSVLPSGALGHVSGRFMPGIGISVTPTIDAAAAAEQAVKALLPNVVEVQSPPALTVFTDDLRPRLGWSVVVHQGGHYSWTVAVDARDGAVIRISQNWIDG